MKLRSLFSRAGFVFLILIGAFAAQAAPAGTFYWRYTPLPSVQCSTDGNVYLSTTDVGYEWNLPSGASLTIYVFRDGTQTSSNTVPGTVGAGSSSPPGGYVIDSPAYPISLAFHVYTIIDSLIVYRSTITFTCLGDGVGTAVIVNEAFSAESPAPVPLAPIVSACPDIPEGSVVGDMPNGTQAFYEPGNITNLTINPGTYWVIGEDESGRFYKILLACQYLWVPVETMQPSFQSPWSGQPLPTRVVS